MEMEKKNSAGAFLEITYKFVNLIFWILKNKNSFEKYSTYFLKILNMRSPGIEPGSQNWKSWMIATTQRALNTFLTKNSIKLSV